MTNDDGVWKGLVMTPLTQIQTLGGNKINKKVWCKAWNIVMKWYLQACLFVTYDGIYLNMLKKPHEEELEFEYYCQYIWEYKIRNQLLTNELP
jgi:hypothetical protein